MREGKFRKVMQEGDISENLHAIKGIGYYQASVGFR
tara:strand:- start:283 stop:390 length:108 start_codon:yes stop_codon:yes gene_type:complete